jgi:ATP-dependent DNA helicase RecQ
MRTSATGTALKQQLQEHFGFASFRPGQQAVVEAVLAGRSALAVFPTGAGKSLCYQLPGVLLEGLTLVVSPLIALMEDQVKVLQGRGIAAERLDSTRSSEEIETTCKRARAGELRFLYVAPERLANEGFLRFLSGVSIALLAIDEAHCISDWGHNFRPDYLKLPGFARDFRVSRVLCLTATATPEVSKEICKAFGVTNEDHVQTSFRRPNLRFIISPCESVDKKAVLLARLRDRSGSSAIVYVTLQETAEHVATFLAREGLSVRAYHAGLPAGVRSEVQQGFMDGRIDVVAATIAFGMGIDKADIGAVFHYNLPKSIENYAQETGRAGRDGQEAHCEMLACADDRIVLENFIYGDTPSPRAIANVLDHLLRQGETFSISRHELSRACDVRPTVLATLLTCLELDGILCPTGRFQAGFQLELLRPIERILDGHDSEYGDFLVRLLAVGKQGRRWLTVDVEQAASAIAVGRSTVTEAIRVLERHGDIRLRSVGQRHGYRLGKGTGTAAIPRIVARLQRLFSTREERDIDRVRSMLDFARHEGCLQRELARYFGEQDPGERCGLCSRCASSAGGLSGSVLLPQSLPDELDAAALAVVQQVLLESHAALRSPRQLARFLCGISSPAARAARLQMHECFAALRGYPFSRVLEAVELRIG